jgi:hypothetical protein
MFKQKPEFNLGDEVWLYEYDGEICEAIVSGLYWNRFMESWFYFLDGGMGKIVESEIHLIQDEKSMPDLTGKDNIAYLNGEKVCNEINEENLEEWDFILNKGGGPIFNKLSPEQIKQGREAIKNLSERIKHTSCRCQDAPVDNKTKPSYYNKGGISLEDVIFAYDLGPFETIALKYLVRYKEKNGIDDLKKAKECIDILIRHMEKD